MIDCKIFHTPDFWRTWIGICVSVCFHIVGKIVTKTFEIEWLHVLYRGCLWQKEGPYTFWRSATKGQGCHILSLSTLCRQDTDDADWGIVVILATRVAYIKRKCCDQRSRSRLVQTVLSTHCSRDTELTVWGKTFILLHNYVAHNKLKTKCIGIARSQGQIKTVKSYGWNRVHTRGFNHTHSNI